MRRLLAHLTGGRPMERLGFAFIDMVTRERVWYWRDAFGRVWLATGAWSRFRIPALDLHEP
jgi:hypothetical protein